MRLLQFGPIGAAVALGGYKTNTSKDLWGSYAGGILVSIYIVIILFI